MRTASLAARRACGLPHTASCGPARETRATKVTWYVGLEMATRVDHTRKVQRLCTYWPILNLVGKRSGSMGAAKADIWTTNRIKFYSTGKARHGLRSSPADQLTRAIAEPPIDSALGAVPRRLPAGGVGAEAVPPALRRRRCCSPHTRHDRRLQHPHGRRRCVGRHSTAIITTASVCCCSRPAWGGKVLPYRRPCRRGGEV